MKKTTQCVHGGRLADGVSGGVNSPIYTSSSFEYLDADTNRYPRYFNTPNQEAVVAKLCILEGAAEGMLFSSGMAAISAVMMAHLKPGDHVLLQQDIYGGTHHFVLAELQRLNIAVSFAGSDIGQIAAGLRPETRMIYIETPSNPLLGITDIAAVAELARSKHILTVIDNTFASPINQTPLSMGIDIVAHSGTKYLGGHSDLCCGAVLGSADVIAPVRSTAVNFGGSLNAESCYLLERSLKTLALRIDRQNRNAQLIAQTLDEHPNVTQVYYPGLETHPGHAVARRQMTGFGGMLSFELAAEGPDATTFQKRLQLIRPAVSLGGVESIICSPAATSHAKVSAEDRARMGIGDRLLRLSVGIEDGEDLIADLLQAF